MDYLPVGILLMSVDFLLLSGFGLLMLMMEFFFGDRGERTYQASGNVGRIVNPSSRNRDPLAIRLTGKLILAGRLRSAAR